MPAMQSDQAPRETGLGSIFIALGPAGLLGVLWAILPAVLGIALLVKLGAAATWLDELGSWGIVVYALCFMLTAGLGLLPTYAQAVLGGWVFGLGEGLVGALCGITAASLIGYGISRLVSQDRVEVLIKRHRKAEIVRDALIKRGFWATTGIVTLLRISPNSPFALTNLVMGSCRVALLPYVIGVIVGMTPRTALIVGFAAAAARTGAVDIQTFISDGKGTIVIVVGIVLLLVALGIVSWIAQRALSKIGLDMK